jgi:penicillin-binding protein 1A
MQYPIARKNAPKVIDSRNAFIMTSMMRDVVLKGTATKAKTLGRQDLAGKTGTTNNQIDAWFAGYNPKQVAIAWIGFDQPKSLGKDETGGKAALPIWIHYMSTALAGMPDVPYKVPDGVVQLKVNAANGGLVDDYDDGVYEYFYHENPPPRHYITIEPIEEPTYQDFPDGAFENTPNAPNPLQPQPPEIAPQSDGNQTRLDKNLSTDKIEKKVVLEAKQTEANTNGAMRVLNPSGF